MWSKNYRTARQVFCFISVAAIINLSGFILYLLITSIGGNPKFTMTFLYVASVTISFLANRKFTFNQIGSSATTLQRYLISYLIGYLMNLSGLIIGVDFMKYPHYYVQAFLLIPIALTLFCLQKYWVFEHKINP